MKKYGIVSLAILGVLVLLVCSFRNEKGQDAFYGIIAESTETYYMVSPSADQKIARKGKNVLVSKDVVRDQTVDYIVGERVHVVFHKMTEEAEYLKCDIVYAIYGETEDN